MNTEFDANPGDAFLCDKSDVSFNFVKLIDTILSSEHYNKTNTSSKTNSSGNA